MEKRDFSRLQKNRAIYFKIGLICSLCLVFLAFNYTSNEVNVYEPPVLEVPHDFIVVPPMTVQKPKPLPPPPPPKIIKDIVLDDKVAVEVFEPIEKPKPILVSKATNIKRVEIPVEKPVEVKPIVELPDEDLDDEPKIFTIVEQMPRFNACEDLEGTNEEKRACAEKKMLEYIYGNIKYPRVARENGIEGKVIVRFVIDETGQLITPEVLRDIGGGCGKETLRVVKKMAKKKWIPGRQRNNAVKVEFNLPVTFRLN